MASRERERKRWKDDEQRSTLSHYRLIHHKEICQWPFMKYYWNDNEHFTLCLICNSSACSNAHTKYHISFHATWASCLWTCLNKLYRGENDPINCSFSELRTHIFLPLLRVLWFYFLLFLYILPCLASLLHAQFLGFVSNFFLCVLLLLPSNVFYACIYIWDSCFCSFASCLYKSMKRIKHEPGKRLRVVRLFCHTQQIQLFVSIWYFTSLPHQIASSSCSPSYLHKVFSRSPIDLFVLHSFCAAANNFLYAVFQFI